MGEERRRFELGMPPRTIKPGQPMQINLDRKNAVIKHCKCGGEYFDQAIRVFTVSALVSPTGKDLIGQEPVLICRNCGAPFDNANPDPVEKTEGEQNA